MGMIRHVVLFKFHDHVLLEDVRHLVDQFMSLKNKIPELVDIEWGLNESPENLHQGFSHCFLLTLKSWEALQSYQEHPAHLDFQHMLQPAMEKAFVVDYVK